MCSTWYFVARALHLLASSTHSKSCSRQRNPRTGSSVQWSSIEVKATFSFSIPRSSNTKLKDEGFSFLTSGSLCFDLEQHLLPSPRTRTGRAALQLTVICLIYQRYSSNSLVYFVVSILESHILMVIRMYLQRKGKRIYNCRRM